MASTVNLPVIGPANKGTVVGVAIGGTVLAAYMIYRKQKTAKTQAAAAAAAAAASSGYGYGTAEYGYGGAYNNGYYAYGASGGFNAGYYGYGVPYSGTGQTVAAAATTNAQWSQAAVNQLSQDGYNSATVLAALGVYLAGGTPTADQQSIIQQAIAVEGYPPQAGANGFPPSINPPATTGGGTGGGQTNSGGGITGGSGSDGSGGSTSDGSSGGSSPATGTVPNVVGQGAGAAQAAIISAGFVEHSSYNYAPYWGSLAGKRVVSQTPGGGSQATLGSTVDLGLA